MKRVATYFVQGLIILVPIGLTFWVLGSVFITIDQWTREQLSHVVPVELVPGVGLLAMFLLIVGTGFLGSHFFTRRLVAAFAKLLDRVPVVKMLHGALRDLMSAFVGPERRFDRPVAVDMPGGLRALGFVTRDSMANLGFAEDVAVYFPQAYNFAGQVLLAPKHLVHPLTQASADVMTFIVSGGISGRDAAAARAEPAAPLAPVSKSS